MAKMATDTSAAALSAALAAPVVEKDDFGDAFASFTSDTKEITPAPVIAEAPAKTGDTPAEKAADGKEAEPAAEGVETEIEGAPGGAEGEEKTPEQIKADADAAKVAADAEAAKGKGGMADDAIARLADILTQRQTKTETKTETKTTPVAPTPLYTDAEVTKLQEFYKEWPEVAQATETLLRGAMTNVTNHIFAEVAKVVGPKLALLEQLADDIQHSQLREAIPDYNNDLQEKVTAWVEKQPAYLRAAYTNVMQVGTTDDISDLVNRFRQETGTAAPGERTEGSPSPAPAKQAATLSPAAKKAVAALAPVNSKRTGNTQVEPQTFDEMFELLTAKAS